MGARVLHKIIRKHVMKERWEKWHFHVREMRLQIMVEVRCGFLCSYFFLLLLFCVCVVETCCLKLFVFFEKKNEHSVVLLLSPLPLVFLSLLFFFSHL